MIGWISLIRLADCSVSCRWFKWKNDSN